MRAKLKYVMKTVELFIVGHWSQELCNNVVQLTLTVNVTQPRSHAGEEP